jgi:hypothetical protein
MYEVSRMRRAAYPSPDMDHLFQLGERYGEIHGPWEDPMLEGYSTIAYLAAKTQRIKLGLLVTCGFFRPPGLLIKTVSTIDVLSGGRAMLGIGAGWFEEEAIGLGIPHPTTWSERFERLEETLQIAHHMREGKTTPFEGKYYQLANPIKRKLDVLQGHCEAVGRPYGEIEKSIVTYIKVGSDGMTSEQVLQLCHDFADLGFQYVIFVISNCHEIEPLAELGRNVIPAVSELV